MSTKIGIDQSHGFMQEIINNQFERKSYQLEVENLKAEREQKVKEYEDKVKSEEIKKKEERRKKREKVPTQQTYIPPSQRKVQATPPRYLGKTVFKMDVEYAPNKFAPIRIRESECIKKACQLFVSRYNLTPDHVAPLEAHITIQMGLVNFPS